MGEVQLLVRGAEVREEVEDLVQRAVGFGIGLVDLVQHDDGAQAQGECLGQHELGLGHRALGRVDQQADAVHHREDALDLAAEVGVAGRVDDVDPGAVPFHAGALGEDGDPALAFDVIAVHRAFGDLLAFAEGAGLFQKLVDEGGLAMVDVRDDRDVAKLHRGACFPDMLRLRAALHARARKGQRFRRTECDGSRGRAPGAVNGRCSGRGGG